MNDSVSLHFPELGRVVFSRFANGDIYYSSIVLVVVFFSLWSTELFDLCFLMLEVLFSNSCANILCKWIARITLFPKSLVHIKLLQTESRTCGDINSGVTIHSCVSPACNACFNLVRVQTDRVCCNF